MKVDWLEQTEGNVPGSNDWLSEAEATHVASLRVAKRRADWRRGRWTAKLVVASHLNFSTSHAALSTLEVRAAPDGSPEVYLRNRPLPITISLSHCADVAVCAVVPAPAALGCDLEEIQPRSAAFVSDYFTREENAQVERSSANERPRVATLIWSAKESALKALRVGLRLDTRSVAVRTTEGNGGWLPLQVSYTRETSLAGWWQADSTFVRTIVSDLPLAPPPIL